jgi:hypothetical protein
MMGTYMYWLWFLVAFIVMMIAEGVAIFKRPKCDEYCSEEAWKLMCSYYEALGYVDSCDG